MDDFFKNLVKEGLVADLGNDLKASLMADWLAL